MNLQAGILVNFLNLSVDTEQNQVAPRNSRAAGKVGLGGCQGGPITF